MIQVTFIKVIVSLFCFFSLQFITSVLHWIVGNQICEVCTPSRLFGSLQKVGLRSLMDRMNCGPGQTSALSGNFLGTCSQSLCEVWTFGFRHWLSVWRREAKVHLQSGVQSSLWVQQVSVLHSCLWHSGASTELICCCTVICIVLSQYNMISWCQEVMCQNYCMASSHWNMIRH